MLKVDLYRAIFSGGFIIGVVATIAIFYYGSIGMMSRFTCLVEAFTNSFQYNNITNLLILTSCFIYASSFATDCQTHFSIPLIARSNKNTYLLSRCISNAISSGLALVFGAVIFIGVSYFFQSNVLSAEYLSSVDVGAFTDILLKGNVLGYFAGYIYVIFIQAAFFSSLGLCITSFVPNKYVAYVSPFALSFFFTQIVNAFDLPIWMNPVRLASARISGESTQYVLSVVTIFFVTMMLICFTIFFFKAKRRLSDD